MNDFTNRLTSSCIEKRSFGLDLREEVRLNDDDTLAVEDALDVWLDYLLDDLNGLTAAILRRDRFKLWCSEYEYQMGRHFHGFFSRGGIFGDGDFHGGVWGCLEDEVLDHIQKAFHDRFMSAREHVIAAQRDILRGRGQTVVRHMDQEIGPWYARDDLERQGLQANLSTEETIWETYYPDGIEPKFGNENWEDTQQSNLVHRLELPKARDLTACQTFPPRINACKHCDQDPLTIEVAKSSRQPLREYLFKFRPGPAWSGWLGPIEPPTRSSTFQDQQGHLRDLPGGKVTASKTAGQPRTEEEHQPVQDALAPTTPMFGQRRPAWL